MGFFETYTDHFSQCVQQIDAAALERSLALLRQTAQAGSKVLVAGNGGSAGIASHFSLDLIKSSGVRALNFNEAGFLTCLANDHGYAEWVERALGMHADPGDLVVLISSSGQSENMLRGARHARGRDMRVLTLTGFRSDNPLRALGDENLWAQSDAYNIVESVHHVWLLSLVDALVAEKSA